MSDPSVPPVPIVLDQSGRINTPPSTLLANLLAYVSTIDPGFTANLPGSLIEDLSSTSVGALVQCDQAVSEMINSLTPYGANAFVLAQQGVMLGVTPGVSANTSVYVIFSGTVGFLIPKGFTVSDGLYQYVVQSGNVIGSTGSSPPILCVATVAGSWAVPANTVTQVITSVPSPYNVTCTNTSAGTPSTGPETEGAYRARVLKAMATPGSSFASQVKSAVSAISGVQPQLISVSQQNPGWKVIVGGGDPSAIANAIFNAGMDASMLVGSVMTISAFTAATNGKVTTTLMHNLAVGNTFTVAGSTPSAYNATYTVATVIDEWNLTVTTNTSAFGAYTANSGYISSNPRNVTVNIVDYPDTYTVLYVNPPAQVVTVNLTWNTTSPFIISNTAVAQLGAPAIATYIGSIFVGQPINTFDLISVFQQAVSPLLPISVLTRIVPTIFINGVLTNPQSGTGAVYGDPESYFTCASSGVTITQG